MTVTTTRPTRRPDGPPAGVLAIVSLALTVVGLAVSAALGGGRLPVSPLDSTSAVAGKVLVLNRYQTVLTRLLAARFPVHVVLRVVDAVGNLRRRRAYHAIRTATLVVGNRDDRPIGAAREHRLGEPSVTGHATNSGTSYG